MRRNDSKAALSQQRAEVRRGAYGKQHVGDDAGSSAAREAMRDRVHRMREVAEATERAERLSQEPIVRLVGHLASDSVRLAMAWLRLPLRVLEAVARRGQRAPA
ncbi:hypothetical protein [Anaeromyxobacter paludicola]|uniref:Uncharacterized protein n=1 Tax=Anaeromyxobacter paludicola TaxID=2918171 RepID=A0ABM7X7B3_9BACT|nr:hypothetical protein [Anaeromyxobacter paludicola]BDG07686.1 hypothetical protein AMPC_07990 [Anaeromyxobacter paludicola]